MSFHRNEVALLLAYLFLACGHSRSQEGTAPSPPLVNTVRYGPERSRYAYEEAFPEDKRVLFEQINKERKAAGLRQVAYDLRGARAGDEFCKDSAETDATGHWDVAGRSPYLRWGLLGGVDRHAQNFASQSRSPGPLTKGVRHMLLSAHAGMMAETPPEDGHRRTVLDPAWTHVGIGAALIGGEFRMTEEFSGQVLEWIEVPAGPVKAGQIAPFEARLPQQWNLASVEVSYEPPPKPMTREEIEKRRSYSLPPAVQKFRVRLRGNMIYPDGSRGEVVAATGGAFRVLVPLDKGPGNYYVAVFAGEGNIFGRMLYPVTAALIQAR